MMYVFLYKNYFDFLFFRFKDEDEDYQPSLSNMKIKQYGPTADILQNIPNIDQVR